ncbi:MAG: PQQ-dependent sugar dehydrogenase [Pseudomonadota bacterium]
MPIQTRKFSTLALLGAAIALSNISSDGAQAEVVRAGKIKVNVETIASGLKNPWGLAFVSADTMLVTERPGRLRLISEGQISAPLRGVPKVAAVGQGGMLDVALDPDFANNNLIYLSYAKQSSGGYATAVGRGKLVINGSRARLDGFREIFSVAKKSGGGVHFGSRLVFGRDKTLFITSGDRGQQDRAQNPFDGAGSVLRINRDGSIPKDNPFADGKDGAPAIWSTGHRNPQGAALHPETGELWTVEHGARGGDEINRPLAGKNYGWPVISYGTHYSGRKIGIGKAADGFEQPLYYWDPSIAPSGLNFYTGDAIPEWKGSLFVGALKFRMLVRLTVDGTKIVSEERLFSKRYGRIRDVRTGPAGNLWLLTDARDGRVLKISPAQ